MEPRRLMASIVVTNNNDAGPGSLRDAVASAAANDEIDLTARTGTITLASPLVINKSLVLTGPGTGSLTLSGGDITSGLTVTTASSLAISGLTLSHFTNVGTNPGGGALSAYTTAGVSFILEHVNFKNNAINTNNYNYQYAPAISMNVAGTVAMVDCNVLDNKGSGYGGGVLVQTSQFTALRCAFARNESHSGGAVGVLLISNTVDRLANCTIADNTLAVGSSYGTGIYCGTNGTASITNCTITGNKSQNVYGNQGGGLWVNVATGRSTTITNTLIAGNAGAAGGGTTYGWDDVFVNGSGTLTTTNSIIGALNLNPGRIPNATNGNRVGTQANPVLPRLGTLGDHGGDTLTVPLLAGSPAINAGTSVGATIPAADQRGTARVGAVDIGAFEGGPYTPEFTSTPPAQVVAGQALAYQITTIDGDGDAVTLSVGALPTWLSFADNGDGNATLSGTPGTADVGSVAISLSASDGTHAGTQAFNLTVAPPPTAPTFTTTILPDANGNAPYSATIAASDVNGDPISLYTAELLPDWLRMQDNGNGTATLSGDIPAWVTGRLNVVIGASDGTLSTSRGFDINVIAAPVAVNSKNHMLLIHGTDGDDNVHVWKRDSTHVRAIFNGRTYNLTIHSFGGVSIDLGYGDNLAVTNIGEAPSWITAGSGRDTLITGEGLDVLFGGAGDDVIDAGDNHDTIYGGDGNDRLAGGEGWDKLFGGNGRDVLDGGLGRDVLRGDAGRDLLIGRDGSSDWLIGGGLGEGDQAMVDRRDRVVDILRFV